jgi:hypothetical protein
MAKKPTHYRLTVNRPVTASGMHFNPGSRYTVKAAVHDAIKEQAMDAIASADPMLME